MRILLFPLAHAMDQKMDVLVSDMKICVADTFDRYDLTDVVTETFETVQNENWLIAIKQANQEQAEAMLAQTLEPISQKLLGEDGYALVDSVPDEVLSWFVDSSLQLGVNTGTLTPEQGQKCPTCPEPKVNITEIYKQVEIERIVERIVYIEEPFETIVEKIVEVPFETIVENVITIEVPKMVYVDQEVEVEKIVFNEVIVEVEKIILVEPNCTVPEPEPIPEPEPEVVEEEEVDDGKRKSKSDRNKDNVDTYTYTLYTPPYDYWVYDDHPVYYDYNDYINTYKDYFDYYYNTYKDTTDYYADYNWYIDFDSDYYYDYGYDYYSYVESESDDDYDYQAYIDTIYYNYGYYNWYY